MPLSQPYSRVLLFIVIAALLTLVTHQMSDDIINAMLPLYEWMLKQLEYRFDQVSIQLTTLHGERILQVHSILSQPFWVVDANGASQQIAPTDAMLNISGLTVGNILQPLIIIGTLVLAWPVLFAQSAAMAQISPPILESDVQLKSSYISIKVLLVYICRLLLAIPFIILIMLIDMPVQLTHSSWLGMAAGLQLGDNLHVTNIVWLGYWSDFLNGGGLIALSIAVGLMLVGLSHVLVYETIKQS